MYTLYVLGLTYILHVFGIYYDHNLYTDIRVYGHQSVRSEGESTSLNCTTDLAVIRIEWLDAKGVVLANDNNSLLELKLPKTDTENVEFTCRIESNFGVQNHTVILKVLSAPSGTLSAAVSAVVIIIFVIVLALVIIVIIIIMK